MPTVLSLPVGLISDLFPSNFCLPPIRIPFPILRIGSILPCSLNGPLKESLLALFRLAWSNKIQLPVLITVCFLALDVRLQLEINIFWEPPRNGNRGGQRDRIVNAPRNNVLEGEARTNQVLNNAAFVAATLLHRERQRLRLLEERDRQQGLRRLAEGRLSNHRHHRDRNNGGGDEDDDDSDTDTDATLEWCENPESSAAARRRRKKQCSKNKKMKKVVKNGETAATTSCSSTSTLLPSSNTLMEKESIEDADDESENTDSDEEEEEEDDSDTTDEQSSGDDDDDDSDNDDDDDHHHHPGGNHPPRGYDYDHDEDFFGDHNNREGGGSDSDDSSNSPLVVEVEIRQRQQIPVFNLIKNNSSSLLKTGIGGCHLFKYQILPVITANNNHSSN